MIPKTGNEALLQAVVDLPIDFYGPLEKLSAQINAHIELLDPKDLFKSYINYSSYLTREVKGLVELRKDVFMPYLIELSGKSTTGHDCANCSGRCDMQHSLKLMEFTNSINKMKSISSYIQSEFNALGVETGDGSELFRLLSNDVSLLSSLLGELLEKEELLIAEIEYAQKKINAHS